MFQSTHPVWGATSGRKAALDGIHRFNPRTPCGVRPGVAQCHNTPRQVSIHAPRVGCDTGQSSSAWIRTSFNPRTPCGVRREDWDARKGIVGFQSTHPVWGATEIEQAFSDTLVVSIHAPRVGCDNRCPQFVIRARCFNPRTPCGVRPGTAKYYQYQPRFQSTHPVWGAT